MSVRRHLRVWVDRIAGLSSVATHPLPVSAGDTSCPPPTLIYGAGQAGEQLYRLNAWEAHPDYSIVGFIDDDPAKLGRRIGDVRVLGNRSQLIDIAASHAVKYVVCAMAHADAAFISHLNEEVEQRGMILRILPPFHEISAGKIRLDQLRNTDLEALLGRQPVYETLGGQSALIRNRSVLITGAGGSIGSEIARQVWALQPGRVCFLDHDESALHATELSISGEGMLTSDPYVLADIRDEDALADIFTTYRPDVVFHAAALKHVPMLERFPTEGWKTNVVGTLNVLRQARRVGVTTFVNISTDKAADPTTVLGKTKELAERLTAHVGSDGPGRYVSVRFGNVLGSRGSVIDTFRHQIAHDLPVTVTSRETTRYFMTIPEACRLVLEAASIGESGSALILEMGDPVKIIDVAERLIAQSESASPIVISGMRPGEKLHEVLYSTHQAPTPTAHPAISAVSVTPLAPAAIDDPDLQRAVTTRTSS